MEYQGTFEPAPKTAFIHRPRRDGKCKVVFVFPMSGRKITNLIDKSDLETKTAGYRIVYSN